MLKWVLQYECPWDSNVFEQCFNIENIDILKWSISKFNTPNNLNLSMALKGNLEMLKLW